MSVEIERKFLVKSDFEPFVVSQQRIVQGYLSSNPERNVRIRISDEKAFITIKGQGNESGISRFEWEKEISLADAELLLQLCEPGVIDKVRHLVPTNGGQIFEVDVFGGENEGLTVAEIELQSEDEIFDKPEWLGLEITGDKKYYNSSLVKHPYSKW